MHSLQPAIWCSSMARKLYIIKRAAGLPTACNGGLLCHPPDSIMQAKLEHGRRALLPICLNPTQEVNGQVLI